MLRILIAIGFLVVLFDIVILLPLSLFRRLRPHTGGLIYWLNMARNPLDDLRLMLYAKPAHGQIIRSRCRTAGKSWACRNGATGFRRNGPT